MVMHQGLNGMSHMSSTPASAGSLPDKVFIDMPLSAHQIIGGLSDILLAVLTGQHATNSHKLLKILQSVRCIDEAAHCLSHVSWHFFCLFNELHSDSHQLQKQLNQFVSLESLVIPDHSLYPDAGIALLVGPDEVSNLLALLFHLCSKTSLSTTTHEQ